MMELLQTSRGTIEYRHDMHGSLTVLILNGGHTTAAMRTGEDYFVSRGYSILSVSRPGYGGTDTALSETYGEFEQATNELLEQLGIERVILVGISAGGRAAMRFAELHPDSVDKLVLMSAVSFKKWPSQSTRMAARITFNPVLEHVTWAVMRWLLRRWSRKIVSYLFQQLTTLDARDVLASYPPSSIDAIASMFMQFRSGSGFMNDISRRLMKGNPETITQPTLILHSKYDGSVPLDHPLHTAKQIKHAVLSINNTESHVMWLSPRWMEVENTLDEFLASK